MNTSFVVLGAERVKFIFCENLCINHHYYGSKIVFSLHGKVKFRCTRCCAPVLIRDLLVITPLIVCVYQTERFLTLTMTQSIYWTIRIICTCHNMYHFLPFKVTRFWTAQSRYLLIANLEKDMKMFSIVPSWKLWTKYLIVLFLIKEICYWSSVELRR